MINVMALVEGPTERNFGQQLLAPHLATFNIAFSPKVIGKPGHKGGNRWETAKRDLLNLIKQRNVHFTTTMFDFYGMPHDWPGRAEVHAKHLKGIAAAHFIESAIDHEIAAALGTPPQSAPFFTYLSLHEYEALLFSDPPQLASVTMGPKDAEAFAAIVADCGSCEQINDHPNTAPSKRLLQVAPHYRKTTDGPIAATRIGLPAMRAHCPHFHTWLARLEKLASPAD